MIQVQPQWTPETVKQKQPLVSTGGLGRLQPPEQEINRAKKNGVEMTKPDRGIKEGERMSWPSVRDKDSEMKGQP